MMYVSDKRVRGLAIVQDPHSLRWHARGSVEGIGELEAWGASLLEAMETLQRKAERVAAQKGESAQ